MPKRRGRKKRPKTKLSVMVLHRAQDAMELAASIRGHAPECAEKMTERYGAGLRDGETLPDYRLAFQLVARDLDRAITRLVELDDAADFKEMDRNRLAQERRKLISDELYPRTVAVRKSIELFFGKEHGSEVHAMTGRTERTPDRLEHQLGHTLARLQNLDLELPAPKPGFPPVDREFWIGQIAPPYRELIRLNREIAKNETELEFLTIKKKEAMEAFDAAYRDTLRYVQACFRIAGLGARILRDLRPYYRRRRMTREARQKRATRADAATGKTSPKPSKETTRVAVPMSLAEWLEENRRRGD